MKREGNRSSEDSINISNNVIDSLIEGSNNLESKIIEKVRKRINDILLKNESLTTQQVINSNENILILIIEAIRRSVSDQVFYTLNYNWKQYKDLKYKDFDNNHWNIEINKSPNSAKLLEKVILPIRKWIVSINDNISNFIKKWIQFDDRKYNWIFKSGLANIDKIIQFLSTKKVSKKRQSTCKDVVKNAEQSIVQAAKDPFHRALRRICEIMRHKIRNGSKNVSSKFYNKDTEKKMREELYSTENTSESLHNFAWNFQWKSWYLNMDQELKDEEKLF